MNFYKLKSKFCPELKLNQILILLSYVYVSKIWVKIEVKEIRFNNKFAQIIGERIQLKFGPLKMSSITLRFMLNCQANSGLTRRRPMANAALPLATPHGHMFFELILFVWSVSYRAQLKSISQIIFFTKQMFAHNFPFLKNKCLWPEFLKLWRQYLYENSSNNK